MTQGEARHDQTPVRLGPRPSAPLDRCTCRTWLCPECNPVPRRRADEPLAISAQAASHAAAPRDPLAPAPLRRRRAAPRPARPVDLTTPAGVRAEMQHAQQIRGVDSRRYLAALHALHAVLAALERTRGGEQA